MPEPTVVSAQATIEHALRPWVRPDVHGSVVEAVLADLDTQGFRLVRDDEATVERMARALAQCEGVGDWPVNYEEQARAALTAAGERV